MPTQPTKNNLPSWLDYDHHRQHGPAGLEVLAALDRAGVNCAAIPEAAEAQTIAAEADRVAAEFRDARNVTTSVACLAAQVLDGKLTPAKAAAKAAPLDALAAADGPVDAVAAAVAKQYARQVHAKLAAPGDRWVTECLRPHVDSLAVELLDLVADLPDDMTDELRSIHNHDRTIREAWGRLLDVIAHLRPVYDALHLLHSAGLVPADPRRNAGDYWYLDHDALDGLRVGGSNTVAMVVTACRRGHLPTVATTDELDQANAPTPGPGNGTPLVAA